MARLGWFSGTRIARFAKRTVRGAIFTLLRTLKPTTSGLLHSGWYYNWGKSKGVRHRFLTTDC
jgi:hypothetical protein